MTHNTPSDCHMSATEPNLRPSSCPGCGHRGTVTVRCTDGGPHHSKLVCARCGRWLRWLPRPAPEPTIREDRRHVLSQPQAARPEEPRDAGTRLATFKRSHGEIRVSLDTYNGSREFLSLRLWEPSPWTPGEFYPTRKGVTFPLADLEDLEYAIARARATIEQRGEPEPEPQPAGPDDCDKPQFRPKRGRPAPITFRTEDYPRPRAEEFDEFASGGPDR